MAVARRSQADAAVAPETERLARAAARGDRDAARMLLHLLLPRVRNVVRYLVRRDSDTDDGAQEALLAILRGLPTYRGDGTVEAWADRVTARAVFRYLRRVPRHPDLSLVDPASASLATASVVQDEYLLRRRAVAVLDALPLEQRHAVVLHHVLEMTVPEIARELALSPETVRSRLRLARERLRDHGIDVDAAPAGGEEVSA